MLIHVVLELTCEFFRVFATKVFDVVVYIGKDYGSIDISTLGQHYKENLGSLHMHLLCFIRFDSSIMLYLLVLHQHLIKYITTVLLFKDGQHIKVKVRKGKKDN